MDQDHHHGNSLESPAKNDPNVHHTSEGQKQEEHPAQVTPAMTAKENRHTNDHGAHHAHMVADFRKRFWISIVVTFPILIRSPMLQRVFGLREAIHFTGDLYLL